MWKWIKVVILGVHNVLPSVSNLFTWDIVEIPSCPLCSKPGTLEHNLSSCLAKGSTTGNMIKTLIPSLRQSAMGSISAGRSI